MGNYGEKQGSGIGEIFPHPIHNAPDRYSVLPRSLDYIISDHN